MSAGRARVALAVVVAGLCGAAPAAAGSRLGLGFTAGPAGYREERLGLDLEPVPWLGLAGEVARSEASGQESRNTFAASAGLYPVPQLAVDLGAAASPAANRVRSDTRSLDLSWWVSGATWPEGFETLLGAGLARTRYGFRPRTRWVDVEQRAVSLRFGQSLGGAWLLSAGAERYRYDRDLNADARRLLVAASATRDGAALLSTFGYVTGLPRRRLSLGLDWLPPAGGRVGGRWERIDAEVAVWGTTEYRYGGEVAWPVGPLLEVGLAAELAAVGAERELYTTGEVTLRW